MTALVELTDVTLRDGLQMESVPVSLENKLNLFDKLVACGYSRLEVTSFVNPKWVPQFQDADTFLKSISLRSQIPMMAFVPNLRGLERFLNHPIPWVSTFIATSESFQKKNVNASIGETLQELKAMVQICRRESRKVRVYLSTVFGCPYEGKIEIAKVISLVKQIADLGPDEIALSDTIGVAVPSQVNEILSKVIALFPVSQIALHFHNTYGLGLPSAQAGYALGIRKFDGTTGGIGGCPYAKGATGNLATEELQYLFYRQGAMATFPKPAMEDALQFLAKHVKVNSHIHDILVKGGTLYAVD